MARAKNYQAKEAYKVVMDFVDGKSKTMESVTFMARYPAFSAAIIAKDIKAILEAIPYASARQMEKGLRADVINVDVEDEDDEDEVDEEVEEKPVRRTRAKKAEPEPELEDSDEGKYAGKKPKELYDLCVAAGLKVKTGQNAEYYIEKLEYADKKAEEAAKPAPKTRRTKKAEPVVEEDEDGWADEDEEEEEKPKRTRKAAPKKAEPEDDEEEEDDWDF